MTRFTGIDTVGEQFNMYATRRDDKKAENREIDIASAGQMAARGDRKGAAAALMGAGYVDEGMAMEDRDHQLSERAYQTEERGRIAKERTATSELVGQALADGTPEGFQSASAALAGAGNADGAMELYKTGKGLEADNETKQKAEQAQAANSILAGYAVADRAGRRSFVDGVINNPEMRSQIPDDVFDMLNNSDPSDDDAAVAKWVTQHGGNAKPLLDQIEAEKERRHEQRLQEVKAAAKAAEDSGGISPFSPRFADAASSVKSAVLKSEDERIKEAGEVKAQALRIKGYADEFIAIVSQANGGQGLGKNMFGEGPWADVGQATSMRTTALKGITEKLVNEFKKPGTGVFTDDDARRAQKAVMGVNTPQKDNFRLYNMAQHQATRAKRYERFLVDYQYENGIGSQSEGLRLWDAYLTDAPFFGEKEDGEVFVMEDVPTFDQWYDYQVQMARKQEEARATDEMEDEDVKSGLAGYGE